MIRIRKIEHESDVARRELAPLIGDFVRRSDPHGKNGYDSSDITRIMTATATTPIDSSWLAFEDGELVGFCIVCVGHGIRIGTLEGQVVALYVRPGASLRVHREIANTVRAWGIEHGLHRVVGGSQRDSASWIRAGYEKVAVLYSMELPQAHEHRKVG